MAETERLTVVEPLDNHGLVADRSQRRFEVGNVTLQQVGDVLELRREDGRAAFVGVGSATFATVQRVLQALDLFQTGLALRVLRVFDQSALVLTVDGGSGEGLAGGVAGATRVDALVANVHVAQVQTDKAEVVGHLEARAVLEQFAVEEPLDAQLRVLFRLHVALHVQRLRLQHRKLLL